MRLRVLVPLACLGLVSCKTHFTYHYYEPRGDGVLMSDLMGRVVTGRLEYLQMHLPRCVAYIQCVEREAFRPRVGITLQKKVRSVPALSLADQDFAAITFHYSERSELVRVRHSSKIEAQDGNSLDAILELDKLPEGVSAFTMHIPAGSLTEHAVDVAFVRKQADYWEYRQLQ